MDTAEISEMKSADVPGRLTRIFNSIVAGIGALLLRRRFYLGAGILVLGIQLNFQGQTYLHDYVISGKSLPVLSDMILDHLPYYDISIIYDVFSLVAFAAFIVYVMHRQKYVEVPYFLALVGIFHVIRGIFIVLTPLGHPALFDGTEGLFNGFSKFEMGVFPSGHTGVSFLYFLLARDKAYRAILVLCLLTIIVALFLSRGHYSVDVLSGLFFAYAIKAFGDKYLSNRLIIPGRMIESPLIS